MAEQILTYRIENKNYCSRVFFPQITQPAPAVMVLPEWWGLNDYPLQRAQKLAELGYVAMAVDMYGDARNADNPETAQRLMEEVTNVEGVMRQRFYGAMQKLKNLTQVNNDYISAIGYCFGGLVVLEMARAGLDLRAVASFHGLLNTSQRAKLGQLTAQVKVFHGDSDAMVSRQDVNAFKNEMQMAQANYEIVHYADAAHGFSNPAADDKKERFQLPVAYNSSADKDSWKRLIAFLNDVMPLSSNN